MQDALGASDTSPVNWAAELVPVFFVIVRLCSHEKTVTEISVFATQVWNIFSQRGRCLLSLSRGNRHPAISHGVTLSYLKMLCIKLVAFTTTLKLHELAELPQT